MGGCEEAEDEEEEERLGEAHLQVFVVSCVN